MPLKNSLTNLEQIFKKSLASIVEYLYQILCLWAYPSSCPVNNQCEKSFPFYYIDSNMCFHTISRAWNNANIYCIFVWSFNAQIKMWHNIFIYIHLWTDCTAFASLLLPLCTVSHITGMDHSFKILEPARCSPGRKIYYHSFILS